MVFHDGRPFWSCFIRRSSSHSSGVQGRGEVIAEADLERERFFTVEVLSILAVAARFRRRGAGGAGRGGDDN